MVFTPYIIAIYSAVQVLLPMIHMFNTAVKLSDFLLFCEPSWPREATNPREDNKIQCIPPGTNVIPCKERLLNGFRGLINTPGVRKFLISLQ